MAHRHYDLICMGRTTLDLFGDAVGMNFADQLAFRAYLGGCPANICVGAHRLGLSVTMLTGVSDDYVGAWLRRFFELERIPTDYIHTKPGTLNNLILAALQPPDGMQFVPYHAANADLQLTTDDVDATPIDDSHALLFTGMGFLQEPSRNAQVYAAHCAQDAGTAVFMDADYRPSMWASAEVYREAIREALPLVDYFIGTEDEVCAAVGIPCERDAVAVLLESVRRAVIVKRDSRGSYVFPAHGAPQHVAPFPARAINPLGAGDAFAAGFIYGWRRGGSLVSAARMGNAAGALMVTEHGTGSEMPTLKRVLDFIDTHGGF